MHPQKEEMKQEEDGKENNPEEPEERVVDGIVVHSKAPTAIPEQFLVGQDAEFPFK